MLRRVLLFPFAMLYWCVVAIRNFCYDKNIFRVMSIGVPVVSVGNITAGGTGKTPFTIALCNGLKTDFKHIVVLSRGYGRASRGARLVSLRGELKSGVYEAGDEPYLIAQRCPHVSVVVAEKRLAGWELIKVENPDLIVLDDGFQHRGIYRDVDIVLNNGFDPLEDDALIPVGRLREPLSALKRASLVCNTKAPILRSKIAMVDCTKYKTRLSRSVQSGKSYVLITGVANPEEIRKTAESLGVPIARELVFRDHVDFRKEKIELREDEIAVVTEKDQAKLAEVLQVEVVVIQLEYVLDNAVFEAIKRSVT